MEEEAALSDLKVIECGYGLGLAFAGKAFADLGAEVIKVEPPAGDASRRAGPFPRGKPHPEKSGQFLYLNANKLGITLNLDAPPALQILRDLAAASDILLTDLPPSRLEALELTFPLLHRLNQRLVMTCISAFGHDGPYRDYVTTDLVAWHAGGTGAGTPYQAVTALATQPPLRGGGNQAEYLAGWTAASATMVAVFYRRQYGVGQMVDVSMMEAVANMLRPTFAQFDRHTFDPETVIPRAKRGAPWIFPCKDGHVSISFMRDHWWEGIKDAMGNPGWAEAFPDSAARRQNYDALEPLLIDWLNEHTRAELYEMLVPRGVPCFPVNSIEEVSNSDQYAARGFFVEQEHPVAGTIRQPGPPMRFSLTAWRLRKPAPLLGQHTEEILARLGYHPSDLARLKQAGAV